MSYAPVRAARHGALTLRGIVHHVSRWGPESDDPIVMLHGWADTADTFQFLVDALDEDWPLVAIDWRGFGRSEWVPGGYWFPDYYADLDVLLDSLCPHGPARLLGHSMGGNIAMGYAGIRPARVRSVVNLEGFGLPRSDPADAPKRLAQWLDQLRDPPAFGEFDDYATLAKLLARRNPRLPEAHADFIARSWARPGPDGRVNITADPAHKLVNPYLYRREEAEALWRQVEAPVLLVLAGLSESLAKLGVESSHESFRACIRKLQIEVIATAGHMLHHEDPAAVARAVEPFLRAHP
jgi:pimeloyl-ACP methyl ester carboxylesterase